MFATDIGIDYRHGECYNYAVISGIVVNEPSVAACDKRNTRLFARGKRRHKMIGRTPEYIVAVKPLKDGKLSLIMR